MQALSCSLWSCREGSSCTKYRMGEVAVSWLSGVFNWLEVRRHFPIPVQQACRSHTRFLTSSHCLVLLPQILQCLTTSPYLLKTSQIKVVTFLILALLAPPGAGHTSPFICYIIDVLSTLHAHSFSISRKWSGKRKKITRCFPKSGGMKGLVIPLLVIWPIMWKWTLLLKMTFF